MRNKKRKPMRTAFILLYVTVAVGLICSIHPFVHALGRKTVTLEIGTEDHPVKAVLTENGTLTISGKGRTRNYTEETAPFAEYADRITSVKIKDGVTSIGDYLFYNCGNLKGRLTLPSSVIWIGEGAFSGEDQEHAARFGIVESRFAGREIGLPISGMEHQETQEAPPKSSAEATPGDAQKGPGETVGESVSQPETEAGKESTADGSTESAGESGEVPSNAESTGSGEMGETTGGHTESSPETTESLPEEPEGADETPTGTEKPDEESSGTIEETEPKAEEGTFTAASSLFARRLKTFSLNIMGNMSGSEQSEAEEPAADESMTAQTEPGTEPDIEPETRPHTASSSTAQTEDEETEETEDTEEDYEDGILSNDLYEGAVDAEELTDSQRVFYTFETIVSQIMGTEIFYPGQTGTYACEEENTAFVEAAEQAGYRKADRLIEVDMEGIRESMPVIDGHVYAPELPEEFPVPEESGDPLFTDSFRGWMLEQDWESAGYEAAVYAPGATIAVEEETESIKLFGNWEKTLRFIPEVQVQLQNHMAIYQVTDSETGEMIPRMEGYQISYQWQVCGPEETAQPDQAGEPEDIAEEEPSIMTDDGPWVDIEGANEAVYERVSFPGDEERYFRVQLTVERQTRMRSAAETVTVYSDPVQGERELQKITITYEAGEGGSGTAPEMEPVVSGSKVSPGVNVFTRAADDGKVFTGWRVTLNEMEAAKPSGAAVSNEGIVEENDVALTLTATAGAASPSVVFTAQWAEATVVYVSTSGNDSNAGTRESPFRTLAKAYSKLPEHGSAQTNIVELLSDYSTTNKFIENGTTRRNVTIRGQGVDTTELSIPTKEFYMQGDMIITNLHWKVQDYVECCGYNLNVKPDAKLTAVEFYLLHNAKFPTEGVYGPHGTSVDDPIRAIISNENSLVSFRFVTTRNPENYKPNPEAPVYTEVTVNGGTITQFYCGGPYDKDVYLHAVLNMNGGTINDFVGSHQPNSGISTYHGSVTLNMSGGYIKNLYGGPLGRNNSDITRAESDVEINISDGNVDNCYVGGATGAITGTLRANISGGTIGTYCGGGYGYSPEVQAGNYYDNAARVTGDVVTNITGGTFLGNVYAGGRGYKIGSMTGVAGVDGDVSLTISGDAVIQGSVFGGGQGLFNDVTAGRVFGDSTVTISGGTIAGNVYGGGEQGSVNGTATVKILPGADIKGTVFGGGDSAGTVGSTQVMVSAPFGTQAAPQNIYGAGNGSGTNVGGKASVTVGMGADIYGNIFGGGEAGKAGTTEVLLQNGKVTGNVFGGGNQADVTGTVTVTQSRESEVTGTIYGGSNSLGTMGGQVSLDIGGHVTDVYGGGLGGDTSAAAGTSLTISDGAVITGNVYGGGSLGSIKESLITLQGGTVQGNVFGSGNAAGAPKTVIEVPSTAGVLGSIYGGSNEKGETAESYINVHGNFAGSIFGGGYGTETTVKNSKITVLSGAAPTGTLYGGGEMGKTEHAQVLIANGGSAADIFGGGRQADVTASALLTVESGAQAVNVYGGSNKSGTVTGAQLAITGTVTHAYGGGLGGDTVTKAPSITAENGSKITEAYGGGQEGKTEGGTTILLKNGSRADKVFGGGNLAGVTGTASIQTEDGSKVWKVFGGSNSGGTVEAAVLTINGTVGGTGAAGTAEGPGAVYGGGLGGQTSTTKTEVEIGAAAVITGEVFGGGANGPVAGDTKVVLKASSQTAGNQITGNVYAGGDAAPVNGSTRLEANDGSVIAGSLYGGGKGKAAVIGVNTRVLAFAHVTGNVFGGGEQGDVTGSTHVDIAKGTIDGDGVNTGNVFGGSDRSYVHENTEVHIGVEAATGTDTDVRGASLTIKGSVFGGGNTTDNGSTFDASDPFVKGTATVKIDGSEYSVSNFNIGKNILGDGNMCTVEGIRTVTIKGYQAVGDQANTSIQRADVLTLENSSVELVGAIDSANLVPTIAYSLNRIDDLRLVGGSVLKLQSSVNLVRSLKSLDKNPEKGGIPVTTTSTTTSGVKPGTENKIYIQQGAQMELRTSEDITTTQYGTVSGYSLLFAYDINGAKIQSGVYVLGGYGETAAGGFLYGEAGEDQYKMIDPRTDEKTWKNWALGTDMTKNGILVISNKPAGRKILQMESPWGADGSIYRPIEDTQTEHAVEIVSTDGNVYTLQDPAAMNTAESPNTTLGISFRTGSQGWMNQVEAGYLKGSSDDSSSWTVADKQTMRTLNNQSIKPIIEIELTNRLAITASDPEETYPLTVRFKLDNIKVQSDGSEVKQGKLTIELQIRRESTQTYADILLAPGKEYVRGTQTYVFGGDKATAGMAGMTISKQSAITVQYTKKDETQSKGPRTFRLKFHANATLDSPGDEVTLPEGVTIQAIDRTGAYPEYAYYKVPSTGTTEVSLTDFTKNGTDAPYVKTFGHTDLINYLLIIDFQNAPSFSQEKLCVSIEPVYDDGSVGEAGKAVFNILTEPKTYDMSSSEATGESGEGAYYERKAVIPTALRIWATGGTGIDTTGKNSEMGVCLRLKNRDTGIYIPIPTNWYVKNEETSYTVRGNDIIVPLFAGMAEMSTSLEIGMDESSLSAGKYQWELHLISSPPG